MADDPRPYAPLLDLVMAEEKRHFLANRGDAMSESDAERIWEAGVSIHRNAWEWHLSVLNRLGYEVVKR